ncbi:MAG: TonB-dependent receptor [Crocinitomicaceae bacterium]|nr:TonB-dependent receptor [Crocinitomicaceae bacterium]
MKITVTLIAFALTFLSYGQNLTQTVRGSLKDKQTFQPIIGAKVIIADTDPLIGSVTDLDGKFRIENVPVGRHQIAISFVGYEPIIMNNIEVGSKEVILDLEMTEAVNMMKEVEVTAQKEKGEHINKMATVSVRQFSVEQSNRFAGSFNDVARMAQNFAGVQGADDSRNDIVIRGNSPTGVLFRMEGIDIPNPNHFARFGTTGGPVSILNNNVLANSDFMTAAFPAEYGNAIAGVFDLKMRTGNNEKHEFMFQFGFNGAEMMAEGPISRKTGASYLVNYRYSTLILFKKMGINFGSTALPNYQDGAFKFNFPSKGGLTTVFGMGGLSNINILAKDADSTDLFALDYSNTYFDSKVGVVGVTHRQRIGTKSYMNFSVAAQGNVNVVDNDTVDYSFNNPFKTYESNSYIGKIVSDVYYNRKINAKNMFKVGFHTDVYLLNLLDSVYIDPTFGFMTLRDYKGSTVMLQPYAQYRYRPTDNLTFNVGLHSQTLTLNKETFLEPRFGMAWDITKKDKFTVGYGLHSQMQPIEIYFKQDEENGVITKPTENLKFTKSHHVVVGYQHRFPYNINVKAEAYYQYLFDVPVTVESSTFCMVNFGSDFNTAVPTYLDNDGKGRNYGVELTVEKYLDKGFYFLVNSSLYESKYTASNGVEYNSAFNGNFTFNSLAGYEFRFKQKEGARTSKSLTLDTKFTYNGGKRYTPVLVNESMLAGYEIRDWTNTNTARYPDYMKLNFRIAFKVVGKKVTQEWAADIQNVTNRKNVFVQNFNAQSGTWNTTYQTGFLPIGQYRLYF